MEPLKNENIETKEENVTRCRNDLQGGIQTQNKTLKKPDAYRLKKEHEYGVQKPVLIPFDNELTKKSGGISDSMENKLNLLLPPALKALQVFACDPLGFVQHCFPEYPPLPWQANVLTHIGNALQNKPPVQVAVASGHGVGKSALVSWLILWGLSTKLDTRGVVTANTATQLQTKTWAELSTWMQRFPYKNAFDLKAESISSSDKHYAKTWRLDQIPWSLHRTEAFAGLHNQGKRILLIFDEASAIPDAIWEVAEGALTDIDTEIIWTVFGNPTQNTGRFRECFRKLRHRWETMQIDSRSVPITNKAQIQQWVDDYGEDADFVRVRVKGQFPRVAADQLISTELVEAAAQRKPIPQPFAPLVIGVDVARFGIDRSVIAIRQGLDAKSRPWRIYHGLDTMQLASEVANLATQLNQQTPRVRAIFVDGVGVGAGVADRLKQLGYPVIDVQSGQRSPDGRYANLRAKMWVELRDWLKQGGAIPDDQNLAEELTSPKYGFQTDTKLILEKKDDMRKRGIHSPDSADALALTFALPLALDGGPSVQSANDNAFMAEGYNYDPYAV